jgi:hypothetical protein
LSGQNVMCCVLHKNGPQGPSESELSNELQIRGKLNEQIPGQNDPTYRALELCSNSVVKFDTVPSLALALACARPT